MILVVGMHRSGTSAVTRALSLCGASVPSDLLGATAANPDGFWESKLVVLLHDELLASIGFTWDDVREFPSGWFDTAAAADYRARLWDAVEADVATRSPLLLKDPRLCRLVPLWSRIAQEHAVGLSFVIPLRNPLDVADLLLHRDRMPQAKALLLWLRHFLEAERATRGAHRCIVAYERLMDDGVAMIGSAAHALGLAPSPLPADAAEQVEGFLKRSQWHHRSQAELEPGWLRRVHDWGLSAMHGREPDTAMLDAVSDGLRAAEAIHRPLVELVEQRDARAAELCRRIEDGDAAIRTLEEARLTWLEERRTLYEERTTLYQERNTLHRERDGLLEERNTLYQERNTLHLERDTVLDERNTLHQDQRTLYQERNTLYQERNTLHLERAEVVAERNTLYQERNILHLERDGLREERNTLHQESRMLVAEQNTLYQERHSLREERNTLHLQRDTMLEERNTLVAERNALHDERRALREEPRDLLAAREAALRTAALADQARQAVMASTSWRVTAPLRSLGRLARGRAPGQSVRGRPPSA